MNQYSNFKGAKRQYSDRFATVGNGATFEQVAAAAGAGSPIGFTDAKKMPGMLFMSALAIHKLDADARAAWFPWWAVDVITRYWGGDLNATNKRNAEKLFNLFAEKADSLRGYQEACQAYEAWYKAGRPADVQVPAATGVMSPEAILDAIQGNPDLLLRALQALQGVVPAAPAKMTARERYEQAVRDAAKADG
jgi:hypothetical protein